MSTFIQKKERERKGNSEKTFCKVPNAPGADNSLFRIIFAMTGMIFYSIP